MANDNRMPRELETRAQFTRPEAWSPPDVLPMPIAQDGWTFRYVRTATMGQDDSGNVNRSFREGFEPVLAKDHPEIAIIADQNSKFKGNIEIGGLLLCKAPTEFMTQRAKYYKNQTQQQQRSVDNSLMKENDNRMPLFQERKTKVTFGSGEA